MKGGCNMAEQTANYGLHQWEPEDSFLRTDFNEDFQKIDTALGEKAEVAIGSYTGNGASSRTIPLGGQPKVVCLLKPANTWPAVAIGSMEDFAITAAGFHVSSGMNENGKTYPYFAIA